METPHIVVVGSVNVDMVVKGERLPAPGETVVGGRFVMAGGGKGANQAVAAARLGAKVYADRQGRRRRVRRPGDRELPPRGHRRRPASSATRKTPPAWP